MFEPVLESAEVRPLQAVALSQNPLQSESIYAVSGGLILSEEETGDLLANGDN
jgi:hypothetical protein